MVSAVIVMMGSAVFAVLALVPDIRKIFHGLRLLFVYLFKESRVNRAAITVLSMPVDLDCLCNLAFMRCHNVYQISDGLRCMSLCSDVNVDFMESLS